jgi:hypothetical protein
VSLLAHFEEFGRIDDAIQREKSLKRYLRALKINLIEQSNPQWVDLYPGLAARNDFGSGASGELGPRPKAEDDSLG